MKHEDSSRATMGECGVNVIGRFGKVCSGIILESKLEFRTVSS